MNDNNKTIKSVYDQGYRVSKNGKVKSPHGGYRTQTDDKDGYKRFTVKIGDEFRPVQVHHLVAYQKFGNKAFGKGVHVRHLNNNRTDNSHKNIDIGSVSDNMDDKD